MVSSPVSSGTTSPRVFRKTRLQEHEKFKKQDKQIKHNMLHDKKIKAIETINDNDLKDIIM